MSINVGFLYPKETILKYGLTSRECVVLDWLVYFMDSGYQEFIDKPDGRYYWVSYKKILQDLGDSIGIHSERSIYSIMIRLIKKGVLSKRISGKNHIRRVYFKFNSGVKEELRNGVKTMPSDPFNLNQEASKVSGLHTEVSDILRVLSEYSVNDTKLFSFKHPDKGGKITKSLLNFNRQVLDMYQGRFSKQKYPISEDFLKRNKNLVNKETFDKLKSCYGDWNKIKQLFISAVENYLLWFLPAYQPLSKNWLPRDVSRWVYEDRNQSSIFLACLLKSPEIIGNKFSDTVVDSLPDNIYSEAIKFKDEFFPNLNTELTNLFWFNVNDVYKVEIKLKAKYRDNYMVSLWLESNREGSWTINYLKWLKTVWGEDTKDFLMVKHIGPKGKPWRKWIFSDEDLAGSSVSETIFNITSKE